MSGIREWWFTLGQSHSHRINGRTFNCNDVIAVMGTEESSRERVYEMLGTKWAMQYEAGALDLQLFPGGVHKMK